MVCLILKYKQEKMLQKEKGQEYEIVKFPINFENIFGVLISERIAVSWEKMENFFQGKKFLKKLRGFYFLKVLLPSLGSWKTRLASCKVVIEHSKSNEMYN